MIHEIRKKTKLLENYYMYHEINGGGKTKAPVYSCTFKTILINTKQQHHKLNYYIWFCLCFKPVTLTISTLLHLRIIYCKCENAKQNTVDDFVMRSGRQEQTYKMSRQAHLI